MTDHEYVSFSKAIVLYIQKGTARWPQSDTQAVVAQFGDEKAAALITRIEALAVEMRMIDIDTAGQSLASASDFVRDETETRYPGLSGEALDALAWKWAFENR